MMNTRNIVIGIIIIVLVAVIGYFVIANMNKAPGTATQTQQQGQAATSTQVQGQDVKVGTGAVAKPGDKVSVLYEGKLPDGTVFDSSAMHGNQPLVFTLGQQGIIPGFQIGVNGMKEGGTRLLAIPPTLGYGDQDVHANPNDPNSKVVIPANSTLVFQVQLVKVEAGTSTPATQ